LTMADKANYNAFIQQFPPISEISFTTVMSWWNVLGSASVARLNKNLVMSCWLPGDEQNTGLSLIGVTNIDETICEIFDNLVTKGEQPRLVHVSEFVVERIRYPEMFKFTGERDYDEYIIKTSSLQSVASMRASMRDKVLRLQKRLGRGRLKISTPDLGLV